MARWTRPFVITVVLGILLAAGPGYAQEYFGKNKVNYDNYDWHVLNTEHFIIYFDKASLLVAEFTAKEAERSLVKIEQALKYTMKGRYPIIVYNSHNGFAVSNIMPGELDEGTGGYTEFMQGRVVIPYTGSYADLRHVIHHELAHAVTIEFWTGGRWMSAMMSQPGALPPLWIMEGLAEYLAQGGWDSGGDNFMRDPTITGYVPSIQTMFGLFNYKGGQSVFYMIEQKYGADKVAEFASAITSSRTVEKALKSSLGIGVEELNDEWQRWLKRQYWHEINQYEDPSEVGKNLTDDIVLRNTYNLAPSFSPQGDKIAYVSDARGTLDIHLMSAIDGKDLGRVAAGARSSDFESFFFSRPGITWSPDGNRIAFAAKSNNKNTLYTMDIRKKRIKRRYRFDLDAMYEPTWSPDGDRIAVVGIKDGMSDIYVVDLMDESLSRITTDPYDEKQLDWSPDGQWIAMSSDRPDSSLSYDGRKDFPFGQYDIFLIRPDGSEIRRVDASEASEAHPSWGPDSNQLAFVSDRTGLTNVFIAKLDSGIVFPVTNLLSAGQGVDWNYLDWSSDGKKLAMTTFHKGQYEIFSFKDPLAKRRDMSGLPLTRFAKQRKGLEDKTFVERQREMRQKTEKAADEVDDELPEIVTLPADSTVKEKRVETWVTDQMLLAAGDEPREDGDGEESSGDDASDGASAVQGDEGSAPADDTPQLKTWEKEWDIKKYRLEFKPEFFAANAGFDTFYGVSSLLQVQLSDVLGDYRVTLVTNLNFSLKDSDLFLTYVNLKNRTNYFTQVFHTRRFFFSGGALLADRTYGGIVGIERPFNRFTRFEASAQFVTIVRDDLGFFGDTLVSGGYLGGTTRGLRGVEIASNRAVTFDAALVDDNTMPGLFGPVDGRRARLSFQTSVVGLKYHTVKADYRKYKRVLDNYTFALRLSGGTSFGTNRQVFFVGGVNNPINPNFATVADVPDDILFFADYVWPLRGADLFEKAGDSFVLTNLAFRFPLIQELAMGWPLPLLFQDVQGELFLDIGGAFWRDDHNLWDSGGGGFELKDLTGGYGLGVRVNVGLFLFRYDLAWPTNLAETFHPIQYFSVDFTGMF